MGKPHAFQQELFSSIRKKLPVHLSLADELADLLNVSADSVYRRIRGETPLSSYELTIICQRYHLSADELLKLKNNSVLFDAPGLNNDYPDFAGYMKAMLEQFHYFGRFKKRDIFYLCKDVPFWYFFLFPEIAAFKVFFWSRTINNLSSFANQQFSIECHHFEECFDLGQKILQMHNEMHSVELWNLESIHSTINQLSYYRDAGIFKTQSDFSAVTDSFLKMIDHLQLQAEQGLKYMPGSEVKQGRIDFYVNELILGNNTILLELDDEKIAMITYNILSYLICNNEKFVTKTFHAYNNLLTRSALISRTGEKERSKFFNQFRTKVTALKIG
ncbi:MAG: helix-turn-helix transcriptional regulator [Chitinophagaceae bacterium]|nr:helix-turn-helix transcriptional regulator [Chitinophagaceae bacterium]